MAKSRLTPIVSAAVGRPGDMVGWLLASGWTRRPRAPGEKSRALIDAHQAPRLTIANTAAFKKETCAMFRARGDFLPIGDTPLSEHDGTLGLHDHHAA
jgi:hypothetical protein